MRKTLFLGELHGSIDGMMLPGLPLATTVTTGASVCCPFPYTAEETHAGV